MIKIDREVVEYAILESLKKEHLKDVNFISLELHYIGVTNAMKSFKSKLYSFGNKFLLKPDIWGPSGLGQLWAKRTIVENPCYRCKWLFRASFC